ncbi:MAG TPA: hypothetical protein VKM55_27630 [Candidatus Lokiarchaeia archaeon]|nr:hypothetical protein [Candidatus Lokiarchaeia archaeon]
MPFSFFLENLATRGFTKKDIDACDVSPEWSAACDAIRAVFFLSRSIRKERDAWLSFPGLGMLVVLSGWSLRYLGPDERSMLMLVDKAMIALNKRPKNEDGARSSDDWIESTPGVRCMAIPGREDALQIYARKQEECVFFLPEFTAREDSTLAGFSIPEELAGIAAASRVCVLLGEGAAMPIPSWLAGDDQETIPERAIKLIKAPVYTKIKLDTIASKIMLFNLIDDNFRVDKREP